MKAFHPHKQKYAQNKVKLNNIQENSINLTFEIKNKMLTHKIPTCPNDRGNW